MSNFKAKCTKFDFDWALPQIPLGSFPRPLVAFKGSTSKSREGEEGRKGEGRGVEGKGGKRREGREGGKVRAAPRVMALYKHAYDYDYDHERGGEIR